MADCSELRRILCNKCRQETNHESLFEYTVPYEYNSEDGDENDIDLGEIIYRLWRCRGCESATLEKEIVSLKEKMDDDSVLFPRRRTGDYIEEKKFIQPPLELKGVYREVIQAFNNRQHVLCSIGIRALLDGICADKDIEGNKLIDKINALDNRFELDIVEGLHALRLMGNDAVHELKKALPSELKDAISICEDLLEHFYDMGHKAKRLITSRQRSR